MIKTISISEFELSLIHFYVERARCNVYDGKSAVMVYEDVANAERILNRLLGQNAPESL
jgi:hypothetical protein